MKKVLMLASVASMIDQFNRDNIAILEDMDFQIDVACNFEYGSSTSQERVKQFKKELNQKNISTFHVPMPRSITKIKDMFSSYKAVWNILNENKYEIIHFHSPIGGVIARIASRKARKRGSKVIYTAHGFHFYKGSSIKNWIFFYPIEKLCARFTDYIITINKEDYQRAIDNNFSARKILYVPGVGVDIEKQQNIVTSIEQKKIEFGITDEYVLLSVGELNHNKNHETIINAICMIDFPIKYIICGKGEKKDYLDDLVQRLGLEVKVIFAGYRNDIDELLKMSDIFCFPSYREGLSVALMEAMAAGLPVICSNIRGNVDLIENVRGGYLSEPNDVVGFSENIKKLISDKNERIKMSNNNKKDIQKFGKIKVNNQMRQIYEECVGK